MPLELKETRLPGVGVKWTMTPAAGSRITVIQHNDGDREVYVHRRRSDEEPAVVLELHDDEARQLGALLGGAYERPKIVDAVHMVGVVVRHDDRIETVDAGIEELMAHVGAAVDQKPFPAAFKKDRCPCAASTHGCRAR